MSNPKRIDYVARDSILKLLSEAELAQVSNAEDLERAGSGEYVDLEHLHHGVKTAPIRGAETSRRLPRSAVSEETWRKIIAVLGVIG